MRVRGHRSVNPRLNTRTCAVVCLGKIEIGLLRNFIEFGEPAVDILWYIVAGNPERLLQFIGGLPHCRAVGPSLIYATMKKSAGPFGVHDQSIKLEIRRNGSE